MCLCIFSPRIALSCPPIFTLIFPLLLRAASSALFTHRFPPHTWPHLFFSSSSFSFCFVLFSYSPFASLIFMIFPHSWCVSSGFSFFPLYHTKTYHQQLPLLPFRSINMPNRLCAIVLAPLHGSRFLLLSFTALWSTEVTHAFIPRWILSFHPSTPLTSLGKGRKERKVGRGFIFNPLDVVFTSSSVTA